MRLFVALRLAEPVQQNIIKVMHDMKKSGIGGNYTAAANLHMTLAFIGETDRASDAKAALEVLSFQPIRLNFSDIGNFGNILWLGAKSNQKLQIAARGVRESLQAAGLPVDKEKFVPHVTLVRGATGYRKQKFAIPQMEMTASRISLMKSEQRNGKVVYTEIFGVNAR